MTFKEDWKLDDVVEPSDVNRWEGNTKEIYEGLQSADKKINEDAKDTFNRYYGLVAQETEYMTDGSVVTTNSEAVITTVFGKNEDGHKTITETIKPTAKQEAYVKVTTIIPATETENKKISETYSKEL